MIDRARWTRRVVVASLLTMVCGASVQGANNVWINPNSGDYGTGSNWSLGVYPGSNDVASFSSLTGGYTVYLPGTAFPVYGLNVTTGNPAFNVLSGLANMRVTTDTTINGGKLDLNGNLTFEVGGKVNILGGGTLKVGSFVALSTAEVNVGSAVGQGSGTLYSYSSPTTINGALNIGLNGGTGKVNFEDYATNVVHTMGSIAVASSGSGTGELTLRGGGIFNVGDIYVGNATSAGSSRATLTMDALGESDPYTLRSTINQSAGAKLVVGNVSGSNKGVFNLSAGIVNTSTSGSMVIMPQGEMTVTGAGILNLNKLGTVYGTMTATSSNVHLAGYLEAGRYYGEGTLASTLGNITLNGNFAPISGGLRTSNKGTITVNGVLTLGNSSYFSSMGTLNVYGGLTMGTNGSTGSFDTVYATVNLYGNNNYIGVSGNANMSIGGTANFYATTNVAAPRGTAYEGDNTTNANVVLGNYNESTQVTMASLNIGSSGGIHQTGQVTCQYSQTNVTMLPGTSLQLGYVTGGDTSSGTLLVDRGATFVQGKAVINFPGIKALIGSTECTTRLYSGGKLQITNGGVVSLGKLDMEGGQIVLESGSLGINAKMAVTGDTVYYDTFGTGRNLSLGQGQSLAVNSTEVRTDGTLTLDGGELGTNSMTIQGKFVWNSGTLSLGSELMVGTGGLLGNNLTLGGGQNLYNMQAITINNGSTVQMAGGAVETPYLYNNGTMNLTKGSAVVQLFLLNQSTGRIQVGADQTLAIRDGENDGRITLQGGLATISGENTLYNYGAISGSGEVAHDIWNTKAGQIYTTGGGTLLLSKGVINDAQMDLRGGTIEVSNAALSNNSTGTITGRGELRAAYGINNSGKMQFSAGITDVYGAVTNYSGGKIIVTGGSITTFHDEVFLEKESNVQVSEGSAAVFFGMVTGPGDGNVFTGSGTKYFEGGTANLGKLSSMGSTVVDYNATVNMTSIRENALTNYGLANIVTTGGSPEVSVLGTLAILSGQVNLNNNDLIVHNTSYGELSGLVRSAYNGGSWDGVGLASAVAQSSAGTGLGVISGVDYLAVVSHGVFDGQNVVGTDWLVKYTWMGDTNFDGVVDTKDYTQIDSGYYSGGAGGTWATGDFNYDGVVDARDYALIDYAYLHQSGTLAESMIKTHDAEFGSAYALAFEALTGEVPEPGSLGLLVAGMVGVMMRGRRK